MSPADLLLVVLASAGALVGTVRTVRTWLLIRAVRRSPVMRLALRAGYGVDPEALRVSWRMPLLALVSIGYLVAWAVLR